jgi:hypothetical protein
MLLFDFHGGSINILAHRRSRHSGEDQDIYKGVRIDGEIQKNNTQTEYFA